MKIVSIFFAIFQCSDSSAFRCASYKSPIKKIVNLLSCIGYYVMKFQIRFNLVKTYFDKSRKRDWQVDIDFFVLLIDCFSLFHSFCF